MVPIADSDSKRVPVPELNNQILLDKETGQIFLKGPVVSLKFTMLLVRHGQTNGNLRKVLQGQKDGPENQLNETGRIQGKQLAFDLFDELEGVLGHKLFELAKTGNLIILKSPMSRAQETAQFFTDYFMERTGLSLIAKVKEDLREMSFGKLDGLALEDIEEKSLRDMVVRYRTTQDATINWQGTGESFVDTLIRAKKLLEGLNRKYQGKDVVVVLFAHGTFGSSLRAVTGDKGLVKDDGMIAFRDRILGYCAPYWLSKKSMDS